MLVIQRKVSERIMIGDDVIITVVAFKGDRIRIGIEAPRHIPIHREEVHQLIKRKRELENKQQVE